MAYKNNLLEYYGGGAVPNRQGYQVGGPAEEEGGEESPWFPTGKFLGYNVPEGAGTVADILASLAIGGGSRAIGSIGSRASKAMRPAKEVSRKSIDADLRSLLSEYEQRSGPIHGNPLFMKSPKLPKSLPSKRDFAKIEADPRFKRHSAFSEFESAARKAEYARKQLNPKLIDSPMYSKSKSDLVKFSIERKDKEMEAYNRMMDSFREIKPLYHPSIAKDAPNYPLAIMRALMEEEGGADYIPAEGFQYGGSAGNSLLGMQAGGGVDFSSLFQTSGGVGRISRAKKINKARKDILGKGKQIAKKGIFSGIGSILGQQFGKKVFGGALTSLLAPLGPLAPIVAQMIAQGGGAYLGAKAGYGKAVKGLGSKGKWLASDYKKLGRAQLGEEEFKERGLAGGMWAGFEGLSDSDLLKNVGDKFKTKLGTLVHGESPVAGAGEALQASEAGQILSQAPEDYSKQAMQASEAFKLKPSEGLTRTLDDSGGMKIGMRDVNPLNQKFQLTDSKPPTLDEFKAAQPWAPFEYSGKPLLQSSQFRHSPFAPVLQDAGGLDYSVVPDINLTKMTDAENMATLLAHSRYSDDYGGGMRSQRGLPDSDTYDPSSYNPFQHGFLERYGRPSAQHRRFQQGGIVRDDMALLDMIYRR